MWHEARKQERLIRGMIVDYRRRAERRKDFYEKIKAEPTQFLQLHGRRCKIHLDPAIAAAGDSPAIQMPWQGDSNNLIDRFDARAHLDYIPEIKVAEVPLEDLSQEERQCNYERYRILAQNHFLGLGEDKFLHQLAIEEKFGVTIEERESHKEKSSEKKATGAAIGYNYSDPGSQPSCSTGPDAKAKVEQKESDDDSDMEIIDVDLSIDVNKMEAAQAHELNAVGPQYGMAGCDLFSFLTGDADDAEHQKQLLREEKEKAMFSGRKSRRERRAHRDKKLVTRVLSPPSYAAPTPAPARSRSRSASAEPALPPTDRIQFITSFGGDDDDLQTPQKPLLYSEKVKQNMKKVELYSDVVRQPKSKRLPLPEERSAYKMAFGPQRPKSLTRSYSGSRSRSRSRSKSRPRARSRSYSRSRSLSRSRSRSRSYRNWSRSRSRSRSRNYRRRSRSRSYTNHASGYSRRNHSRSMSCDSNERTSQNKPAVPRYYGRKKDEKSSSEISLDSESSDDNSQNRPGNGGKSNTNQSQIRSGSSTKGQSHRMMNSLKEKLKRKMQAQLSRQLRADQRAEAERQQRESRRQARRDEEMRELAIKLRRKQREMRHLRNYRSSGDSDGSHSRSSSRDSQERGGSQKDRRSRSKSTTPPKKNIPVWAADENRTEHLGETSHGQDTTTRKYHPPPFEVTERYKRREGDWTEPQNQHQGCDGPQGHSEYEPRRYEDFNRKYVDDFRGHRPRWEHDSFGQQNWRQPYGHRGAFRGGYGSRRMGLNPKQAHEERGNAESDKGSYTKNKVKLVDY